MVSAEWRLKIVQYLIEGNSLRDLAEMVIDKMTYAEVARIVHHIKTYELEEQGIEEQVDLEGGI